MHINPRPTGVLSRTRPTGGGQILPPPGLSPKLSVRSEKFKRQSKGLIETNLKHVLKVKFEVKVKVKIEVKGQNRPFYVVDYGGPAKPAMSSIRPKTTLVDQERVLRDYVGVAGHGSVRDQVKVRSPKVTIFIWQKRILWHMFLGHFRRRTLSEYAWRRNRHDLRSNGWPQVKVRSQKVKFYILKIMTYDTCFRTHLVSGIR